MHATTGQTPGQLFLNRELRTRLDLLKPDVSAQVRKKQAQQKATHDQHAKFRDFSVGDLVYVKNFRPRPEWLPAMVVAKLGPLSYLVENSDHQSWRRHIDHLKSRSVKSDGIVSPAHPENISVDPFPNIPVGHSDNLTDSEDEAVVPAVLDSEMSSSSGDQDGAANVETPSPSNQAETVLPENVTTPRKNYLSHS